MTNDFNCTYTTLPSHLIALGGRHIGQKIVWGRFEVSVRSYFKVVRSLGRVGTKFARSNLVGDQRKMLIRVFVGIILAQKMGLYPWKVEPSPVSHGCLW